MLNSSSYKSLMFCALLITVLNVSWAYGNEAHIENSPLLLGLNNSYFREITDLPHLHAQKKEFVYYAPGHIRYQYLLSNDRKAFAEFSGLLDQDDPLEDFTDYLQDPLNWDPTQFIDRRFLYNSNIGIQQQVSFFGGTSTVRIGLAAHAENAHVHYLTSTNTRSLGTADHLNLIDISYAPYLTLRSTLLDWITFHGDARINALQFDTQNVCPQTCSIQPNSLEDRIVPSVHGSLRIYPSPDTTFFMHVGTGYHSFQEREPIGSTAVEQLNHVTSYQIGIQTKVSQEIEIRALLWLADLGSDRVFLEQGEKVQVTGPSRRRGLQLKAELQIPGNIFVSGNLTYQKTRLRTTGRTIPLDPEIEIETSLKKYWSKRWSSTFSMHHIRQRDDKENQGASLRLMTTFDVSANYKMKESVKGYHGELYLGMTNLSNTVSPYTRFSFDSQFDSTEAQVFNIQYFPGQTRTIIGGMTWTY